MSFLSSVAFAFDTNVLKSGSGETQITQLDKLDSTWQRFVIIESRNKVFHDMIGHHFCAGRTTRLQRTILKYAPTPSRAIQTMGTICKKLA